MWPQEPGTKDKQAVRAWGETPARANRDGEATRPTSFYSRWALLRLSINSRNTRYLQAWLKAHWCLTCPTDKKFSRGNHYFFPDLGYHGHRTWVIFLRILVCLEGRTHARPSGYSWIGSKYIYSGKPPKAIGNYASYARYLDVNLFV